MTVLTLPDAKTYLKVNSTDLDDPSLLPALISAAVKAVERKIGPLEAQTVTERVYGCGSLLLSTLPLLAVTSVTPTIDGAAVDLTGIHADARSGVVSWATGSPLSAQPYDVVYRAGRVEPTGDDTECPLDEDLRLAVKMMLKHLATPYRRGNAGASARPAADVGLPKVVSMLLENSMTIGFA